MKSGPRIFLPNRLSFLRILIGLVIPVLLFWPSSKYFMARPATFWAAFALFLFGVFTDFWDGWMARRHRLETAFGRILDPTADKVFILGTMASFAAKDLYSYWYLVPIFMREIAVTFSRIVWLRQGKAIGAERAGKLKLGLQVTSILFTFFYAAFPTRTTFLLNVAFLILAIGMTLYSGFFFLYRHRNLLKDTRFLYSIAAMGVGYLRPFPGMYGSLVGLLFVFITAFDPWLHLLILMVFILLAYTTIPRLGLTEKEDPLDIVIDEVCGMLLAFWSVPLNWGTALVGLLLFRVFDVSKLFPIQWFERLKGAHGIILDDLAAGVYTWLALKILFR